MCIRDSWRFIQMLRKNVCISHAVPVSPSVATISLLVYRSLSRYYLEYWTSPCHIGLFSSSSPSIRPVPPFTFHISPQRKFYSLLLCQKGTSVHSLPPLLGYWFNSFFSLAGLSPLHGIAFSALLRSPLGRVSTFSFLSLPLTHRISLKCFPSFTLFLSASLSLLSIVSFTFVLCPPGFSVDS